MKTKGNFLADYWHFLVLAVSFAILALGVVFMLSSLSVDADQAIQESLSMVDKKHVKTGVAEVDMTEYNAAYKNTLTPGKIPEIAEGAASFLGPESRVFCEQGEAGKEPSCGMPIPFGSKECPLCGALQPGEVQANKADGDEDGLPDEWEKKYGLSLAENDANGDLDNDGFTNMEEFLAKTNPADAASHPPYVASLTVLPQVAKVEVPFDLKRVLEIPSGTRFVFRDPNAETVKYGKKVKGVDHECVVDKAKPEAVAIGTTGYTLKSFEKKNVKKANKRVKGLMVDTVVFEVKAERDSDKKEVAFRYAEGEKSKRAVIDMQATLVYNRGGVKEIPVVPGTEFELSNGAKYKALTVETEGKGVKVTVEDLTTGEKTTISALEQ